jgi:demethylmenaquinone methyltransferase / 2-methoxy-6-polyprenyl-1,4-benzoquinol methylase
MSHKTERLNKCGADGPLISDMSTKALHVREMFGSIAGRYDLANHVLSCGIDFYWRGRAAEIVDTWHPHTIADLATGTGDLARAMQKKIKAYRE